ncbi:MAG: UTP--glucose-1-phosphate uridylyltransferase [Nitriliruptoraceae bacterium]
MVVRKAVLPVAGLGTRSLPATKAIPKELLPIVDKPAIQYMVEECARAGLDDVLLVTSSGKSAIEDHFDRLGALEQLLAERGKTEDLALVRGLADIATVHSVRQPEPLGLGHAVLMAESHVGGASFAVLLGDDIVDPGAPFLERMLAVHEDVGRSVLALMEVPDDHTELYGIATVEPAGDDGYVNVVDLVEKPPRGEAPSNLAIVGRYVLSNDIFAALHETPPGRGGEIQLTDALRTQARQQPIVGVKLDVPRYDVGDKLGYLQAIVEFAARDDEFGEDFVAWLQTWMQERTQ